MVQQNMGLHSALGPTELSPRDQAQQRLIVVESREGKVLLILRDALARILGDSRRNDVSLGWSGRSL